MNDTDLSEMERMDTEAMPPDWRFESYPSGSRVVTMNAYTVTGEYGDRLPCSGVLRHLTENRQVLCDCHPASARHWVGANHDDQEWQDLAYIAKLRNAAPLLYAEIRALRAERDRLAAELARVKAESLRVVGVPDEGNLYDWYMTPTGLGYPGKDRKQNNCIESAEGYYRLDECQPVRLERWEDGECR